MKKYLKPYLEEEKIEIEDIVAKSVDVDSDDSGIVQDSVNDLWSS